MRDSGLEDPVGPSLLAREKNKSPVNDERSSVKKPRIKD